ncbi:MAG: bifunctional ornithine acetyltransferase/N-acetylglutamate synthase, partial [Gammaproteobacteria bacterium]
VVLCKQHLGKNTPRYFVVNTGNANAGTGQSGLDDALHVCRKIAQSQNLPDSAVLPFSTGVIGEPLPVEKISAALPGALN